MFPPIHHQGQQEIYLYNNALHRFLSGAWKTQKPSSFLPPRKPPYTNIYCTYPLDLFVLGFEGGGPQFDLPVSGWDYAFVEEHHVLQEWDQPREGDRHGEHGKLRQLNIAASEMNESLQALCRLLCVLKVGVLLLLLFSEMAINERACTQHSERGSHPKPDITLSLSKSADNTCDSLAR